MIKERICIHSRNPDMRNPQQVAGLAAAHADFSRELTALIPRMRAFARGMCGDATAADDLTQEALLKAWNAEASYKPGTNLKAWVFMIMRNQLYSEKRRSWRTVALDQEVAERTVRAVSDPCAAIELDELRRALALLPAEQREALLLVGAAGFSYEETAEACGAAVGTVKSRVSRARDRLALIFAEAAMPGPRGAIPKDGLRPSDAAANIFSQCDRASRSVALAA
jgi:RNA polymerase sigma-70 factor (ECF subfamily)